MQVKKMHHMTHRNVACHICWYLLHDMKDYERNDKRMKEEEKKNGSRKMIVFVELNETLFQQE